MSNMQYAIIDDFFEKFGLDRDTGDRKDRFQWTILTTLIEIVNRLYLKDELSKWLNSN